MKQLEAQLENLDNEYEVLKDENEDLIDQNNYMKDINKKLFIKMRDAETSDDPALTSGKIYPNHLKPPFRTPKY